MGLPRRRIAAAAAGDGLVAIIPVMETTSTKSRCAQRTDKGVGGKTIEFLFRGCRHRHLSWLKNRRRKMRFALPDEGWMKKADRGNIIWNDCGREEVIFGIIYDVEQVLLAVMRVLLESD